MPPTTPLPIGQRLIAAKKLYDTLDPSTMTDNEAALHAELGKTFAAQPAIAAYSRGARGAAAGPVTPISPATVRAPSNSPNWLSGIGSGIAQGLSNLAPVLENDPVEQTASTGMNASREVGQSLARGNAPNVAANRGLISAVPMVGPIANDISAPLAASLSNRPVAQRDNTDAVRGVTTAGTMAVAPRMLPKVASAAEGIGGKVLGRFPERMVGSVLGSESRGAARAVMARRIGTASTAPDAAGNLPIENFHNNVTDAWNSAGQDVSRVIAADTVVNPGKTVNVQPLIEAPYSARTQQVGKYARGETSILQQLQRLTEHSEARQAAAAEHVGLKPGVNWFPGDPIEMSPQQMHEFTKDWRKSVAGGFDRMDPTEQAVIGNMHDAIKTVVPGAEPAMNDYHDLSRAKESLDEKVPRIQGGPLIPSMIETMRGAATRKVIGGAAWKLPVAYGMNEMAPSQFRYTGTFRPPMAPTANAAALQAATPPAQVAVRPPTATPADRVATAKPVVAKTATVKAATVNPATVDANRVFTAESVRVAAERERQYPVRAPGGAPMQSKVTESLDVPTAKATAPKVTKAVAPNAAIDLKSAVAAQDVAAQRPRGYTGGKPKVRAPQPIAETAPAAAPPATAPPQSKPAPPPTITPAPPVTANPLADRPSKSTPVPRKMTVAELAERKSGTSTYVNRPVLSNAPKPPSAAGPKVGTSMPTPRGKGTVTHSIPKADGSTLHVVEGVKTGSGKTVIVEPATAPVAATLAAAPYNVGDTSWAPIRSAPSIRGS